MGGWGDGTRPPFLCAPDVVGAANLEKRIVSGVDVYLVPLGTDRVELYCESAEAEDAVGDTPQGHTGVYARFRDIMAEAREDRRARRLESVPSDPRVRQPWLVRLRNAAISRVAEAIAEQRLLWYLRTQAEAELVHPDDLDGVRALAAAQATLQRDADRHRKWLIVDGLAAAALGPLLFFVPGPNLVAYYFTFRAVGHLLAWRGALHGRANVRWRTRASAPLAELKRLLAWPPDERVRRVRDVAARLELEHLVAFVERMATVR